MVEFELLARDGLARLARMETPHGPLETPALLPVVHPDPARQSIPPTEMAQRWGVRAVITSAYITWRTPPLREIAEPRGVHGLLGFDGVVMTDSGAFQQHAYGSVEVGPEEIIEFQNRIRSDIATVLDVFTEPEATAPEAAAAIRTTAERTTAARAARRGLLAVPVQGGPYPDLRAEAARQASRWGDVAAVGGVVPLMEQYRFAELAGAVAAARPALAPEIPVHLFGTGHPMTFAFAALLGVDLFDSSAYHKFARRGKLLWPGGTADLDAAHERSCFCALCAEHPLTEIAQWPAQPREAALARHNLLVSLEEVGRVRQAIRDGTLWELAEQRATAHPSLRAGLRAMTDPPELFWPTEPESRRAFRETGPGSRLRPAVVRFLERISAYTADLPTPREVPRVPLAPEYLGRIPTEDQSSTPVEWCCRTPLGTVPLELVDLYPVGPYLGVEEFAPGTSRPSPSDLRHHLAPHAAELDLERDWTGRWDARQVARLLRWQFGPRAAEALSSHLAAERSVRTGRVRRLREAGEIAFVVGNDSVPRPTWRGGELLRRTLRPGRARVVVHADAAPFVREGRSLFSKFVVTADPALVPDSSALLVDEDDRLLGVGRLLLAPHEMGRFRRGIAAWVTSHPGVPLPAEPLEIEPDPSGSRIERGRPTG